MIPLLDLTRQYYSIKDEINAGIQEVLESGRFILGPQVESLEKEMVNFCQANSAIEVASE